MQELQLQNQLALASYAETQDAAEALVMADKAHTQLQPGPQCVGN